MLKRKFDSQTDNDSHPNKHNNIDAIENDSESTEERDDENNHSDLDASSKSIRKKTEKFHHFQVK